MLLAYNEVSSKVILLKEFEVLKCNMLIIFLLILPFESEVWVQIESYNHSHVSAATNKQCMPHNTRRMIGVITGMPAERNDLS